MTITAIQELLYKSMGLHAPSIGAHAIQSAVNERMEACRLADIATYFNKVSHDKNELKELIEEVVVPETWFFRDDKPFKMLVNFALYEWLPREAEGPLRILSLPCATGEEPYSIAMALIDAGFTPSQVYIDAFDISQRNINKCREARYRSNSFRGVAPIVQSRFFRHREGGYHLDILIRCMVNFSQASILDSEFMQTRVPYDVIFCRNLLIYFDHDTQQRAIHNLQNILNPDGILFVGHAETGAFIKNWHISHKYPRAFAVRKFTDNPRLQKLARTSRRITNPAKKVATNPPAANIPVFKPQSHKSATATNAIIGRPRNVSGDALLKAQQLADSGKFTEAEAMLIPYLEQNKQDVAGYFLLGLIQLGTGDSHKAAQYFRNVIYLDPNNVDALLYMATLTEAQGDPVQAKRFRERAQRARARMN